MSEEYHCPKCGAAVDERFDCCEVHEATAGLSRLLTQGEKQLISQALLNAASQCLLQAINMDILTQMDPDSGPSGKSLTRLMKNAEELNRKKETLEFMASLVMTDHLRFHSFVIIPDIT